MTVDEEQRLLAWYETQARELPWRRSRELYPVLVSELMLQQTTVAAVIPIYLRWMERFPTLAALAEATSDQVMEAWSGLGYYRRARHLHQTAQAICAHGDLPKTLGQLLALPGIGAYTAAAVGSIALGLPQVALDTNALRVLLRLYGWQLRADSLSTQDALRQRVEQALPLSDFGITNQAIMELGATLCKVKAPACLACPLNQSCQAHALALEEQIPVAKPKKSIKVTPATGYLLRSGTAVLLVRGTALGLLDDLYQPPIDFHHENRANHSLTVFLESLRQHPGVRRRPGGDLSYAISGRRLQISLVEAEDPDLLELATELGLDCRLWLEGAELALSSLSRKLLRRWEENRATPQPADETCLEF